jgi:hypothetical protein
LHYAARDLHTWKILAWYTQYNNRINRRFLKVKSRSIAELSDNGDGFDVNGDFLMRRRQD